ncbi:MAG: PHP domain-containing protein [Halobacteriaceae archaeon]
MYADLHVHTTVSDGTLAPAEVPAAAADAGLSVVAVTDHDRVAGALDAPVGRRDGVTLVRGVELRVDSPAGQVDLLGYGVDPSDALRAELDRIQRDRVDRARRMVACVEERLGVSLDVAFESGVGRPHVARAVAAHPDVPYDVAGAFEHLIGEGGPCYVARAVPAFERGASLLGADCALVALAHPFRYPDPAAVLELAADLDAVERYYPYDDPVDPSPVDRVCRTAGLVATGGSDAHGRTLGRAGLTREQFAPVRRAFDERGTPMP